MKGISPLVASVLLIAITMAVAAVLANWITSYTRSTINTFSTCVGGSLNYVSADYPKWDDVNKRIIAAVEAQFVSLGNFKFEVVFQNDNLLSYNDIQGLKLDPGAGGTVISQNIGGSKSDIKQVRITTNCSNVKTDLSTLK